MPNPTTPETPGSTTEKYQVDNQDDEISKLKEQVEEYESFIHECAELIPPSYDQDASIEYIILTYLREMGEAIRIFTKAGADYR
jgi:hypothetical protein